MSEKKLSVQLDSGGFLAGALGIAFIVLKLCGVIDWSWLWVLAPFWMPALLAGVLVIAFVVMYGIFGD